MSDDVARIEEELRSEIYAALVELSFAEKQEKVQVVTRISAACSKLHALIAHDRIPEG